MTLARYFAFLAIVTLFVAGTSFAQTTGTPPFGSFDGGPDVINLANLNVHLDIPVLNKTGRGTPFTYNLSYDSSVWFPTLVQGVSTWQPITTATVPGWQGLIPAGRGYITYTMYYSSGQCGMNGNTSFQTWGYGNFVYHDQTGTSHSFNLSWAYSSVSGAGGCGPSPGFSPSSATQSQPSTDASGFTMLVTPVANGANASPWVLDNVGTIINVPINQLAGSTSTKDRNGNQVTSSNGSFTDTLGASVLNITGTAPSNTVFSYTSPSGTQATYTVKYTSYTMRTNFGCSGISEYGPASQNLVSEIDLPNGTKYTFTYEGTPGHSGNVTGRLASVTLPTGGTISYSYTGGNNGITCADSTTATLGRTTPGGTWSYAHVDNGSTWQTTVTYPQMPYDSASNQTVLTFTSYGLETSRKIYQGAAGGTLLRTVNTTWASNNTPATKITILEDSTTQSEVETTYDGYGNLLTLKEHNFGSGSPGPVLRTTNYTYLSTTPYTSRGIVNLVTEKTIADSTGTVQYREDTAYDGTTISPCPAGVVQHDDTNYGCSFTTRGNPTSITKYTNASAPSGGVTKNSYYDMFGNRVQADDDGCQTMSWNFSATTKYSSPDSVVRGASSGTHLTTNYTYNSYTGQFASIADPNSQITSFAYDSMLRLTTTTRPDLAQIVQSYNDALNTVSNLSPIQGTAAVNHTQYQDGLGRTVQESTFDASGSLYSTVQTEYDAFDRPYNVSNPFTSSAQYWTETTYDALGRQLKVIFPDGSQSTATYSGASTTVTDPAGHQRKTQTDGLNRLSVVYEPDPTNGNSLTLQTNYAYTVQGQLASLIQGSQTRTFSYDGMGRLISKTLPESGTTSFQYNSYNLISQRTEASGVITTYTYDTMNRLYQVSYNVGTTRVPATPTITYAYGTNSSQYNKGRLLTLTDGLGTTTYSYDNLARATQAQHVINGSTYTIGYQYNLAGEVTALTYPSNRVVQRSYDAVGRMSSLSSGTTTYANSFSYNAAFNVTNFTMGNGVAVTRGYSADRLQLQSLKYAGGTTVFSTTYNYSQNGGNNGQITGITDNVDSGRSIAYTYDALNRLSTAVTTGSSNYPAWGLSFTFDRYGNRTAQTVTAGTAYSNSIVVSATTNHITTSGFAYDANGNMTNDAINTLVYDGENRLISSAGSSGSGTYSYRASGLRAVKVSGGTTTVYLYDGDQAIAEYTNGTLANEYVYLGNQRIASHLNGTLYYHASDHQSIRVTMDTNGNVVEQKGQYPFGEDWYPSNLTNRHFTSYERDAESSNDYSLHRFYVNRLGRFSAVDHGNPSAPTPQYLNRYSYVAGDPINHADPSGQDPESGGGGDWPCTEYDVSPSCAPPGSSIPPPYCDPWFGCVGTGPGDCNIGDGNSCPPSDPTPPPPPPCPVCFAQLKNRTVDEWLARLFHAQHDFWYVQDESGSQYFLEAGPSNRNGSGFLDLFPPKPYPGGPGDANAHASFTKGPSANVCYSVDIMEFATENFPQFANVYKPIQGPNSNSAAHYLALVGGFNPRPPFWSPGWNTPIIGSPLVVF